MRLVLAFAAIGLMLWAATLGRSQALSPLPAGIWRTDGYGYVLKTGAGKLAIFDETKAACVFNSMLEGHEASEWTGVADVSGDGARAILHAGLSRIAVTRLAGLPERCKAGDPDPDPLMNFDVFWATFAEHYAFFAERKVDWAAARAAFRPKAAAARSAEEHFAVLSAMVAPLKDAHVALTAGETEYKVERSPAATAPGPDGILATRKVLQRGLKDLITGPSTPLLKPATPLGRNRVWIGRASANIGYVAVFAMGGFEEDDVTSADHAASARAVFQQIAREFAGVRGVIVDLRYNQGGFDTVSLELANLFAAQAGVAFKKGAHGAMTPAYAAAITPATPARLAAPVAVLISEQTVSAGETAAMALRTLPNAMLIGQPTQGALSDTLAKTLPNGWTFTLSNEIYTTADGASPEVTGVMPHVATTAPGAPATSAARFRPDIDEAVRLLKSGGRRS